MWRIIRPDAMAVLNDKMARKSLARYFAVMKNEKPAKFLIAKKLPADFKEDAVLEELWQIHKELTRQF
ncbi:pyruvate formate lyase-activating protein, partial [Candidatus Bathyarchaeota archaeon]|nr:pyruvate formate lyase-activating protein [Candidatus Bathyarchaeota archaeon]